MEKLLDLLLDCLVTTLPEDLAQTILANANHSVNLDEKIEGEVAM